MIYPCDVRKRRNRINLYGELYCDSSWNRWSKKSIKSTGISIIQIPGGVSFAKPEDTEDKMVFVVFGIAGKDGEHLELLSKIAIFCSEQENVIKLVNAATEEEVITLLSEVE